MGLKNAIGRELYTEENLSVGLVYHACLKFESRHIINPKCRVNDVILKVEILHIIFEIDHYVKKKNN